MHRAILVGRFSTALAATTLAILLNVVNHTSAAGQSFSGSVAVDGFIVGYPDGWSVVQDANLTKLLNVTADKLATLDSVTLDRTAQIHISIEQRTDHTDALKRLDDIAAETSDPATSLTIGGWPAIQRRHVGPREQPGVLTSPLPLQTILTITTAIAAGNQLVRLEGRLPADAPSALADEVAAIETAVAFTSPSGSVGSRAEIAEGGGVLNGQVGPPAQLVRAEVRQPGLKLLAQLWIDAVVVAQTDPGPSPILSLPGFESAGAVSRVIIGGVASEPEVAVSTNGRQIVIAQQFIFRTSNDGGQTFPFSGAFPASTGGDSSLAFGKSGNFYEGTIAGSSTGFNVSTDGGQTFQFRANAFTCPTMGPNQCGAAFPDQEHIAADRFNSTASGDQTYSAWRQLNGNYGIVCSTDSGQTWTGAQFTAGDLPRITVGPDGFVYVIYQSGANIMLDKYSSCANGLAKPAGFPRTVASGVNFVSCPVPGLDRCNNGNNLSSFTVAVDDTSSSHIYAAYAVNTAFTASDGTGNENILVQDSTDGGMTWTRPAVMVNTGATGRRFMPWMCTTNGTAFVSWYDRRNEVAPDNDLTDYFGSSSSLDGGGNLVAGAEFQINQPGTSDAQCEAGKPVGNAGSWPGGTRAQADSETCGRQPQLAGLCCTGLDANQNCIGSGNSCDFSDTPGVGTAPCLAGETCRTLPTGGFPKYGDYNGNACAVGHFYTVWASATPPSGITPSTNIDLFFAIRDTVTPIAKCRNVTVPTDPNVCFASSALIDNGSSDPDGDTITLSQAPPSPYSLGLTSPVTLTVTDQNAITASCQARVTVVDQQPPNISCPSPVVECANPSGASVTLNTPVSDNCPGVGSPACLPPSGSTFPLGTTPFVCHVSDAAGNSNGCNSVVKVQDTTPPVISSVSASPNVLWPPNHELVPVSVSVSVHDTCDPNPSCKITSITSNEPVIGPGSGQTSPDFMVTGLLTASLRAERSGTGTGRVYILTVQCTDASGNSASAPTAVTVPHNQ